MTNSMINPQPNYSGVTIQIANPAVYAGGNPNVGYRVNGYSNEPNHSIPYATNMVGYPGEQERGITNNYSGNPCYYPGACYGTNPLQTQMNQAGMNPSNKALQYSQEDGRGAMQSYPAQYYLNNYNYQNNGLDGGENLSKVLGDIQKSNASVNSKSEKLSTDNWVNSDQKNAKVNASDIGRLSNADNNENANKNVAELTNSSNVEPEDDYIKALKAKTPEDYIIPINDEEQDFTKSNAVIEDLDARAAAEEAAKKNSKQKRVVALTDEYIKSLENYLNNQNDEVRLMASKEILKRLDEDKDRYDDAALNALLNKMLQDPSKLIRVAALSAFASQLASGNDYTVVLLQNIQQNPSADKEDVLQAADILLKMSGGTEIKNIPNPAVKEDVQENKG